MPYPHGVWYAAPNGNLYHTDGTQGPSWASTFILRVTEPTAALTGHRYDQDTVVNTRLTTSSAGQLIQRTQVDADFRPAHPGTMRDCLITNGAPTSMQAMIDVRSLNVTDTYRIEHTTLTNPNPSVHDYGFRFAGIDAYRCRITGIVDGAQVYGTLVGSSVVARPVKFHGCYFANSPLYAVDPQQGGGPSHNDGIQGQGGITNLEVIGCSFGKDGPRFDACLMLQTSVGQYGSITIEDNWFYGHTSKGSILNTSGITGPLVFKRNRISRDSHLGGQILVRTPQRIAANFGMTGTTGDCRDWQPGPDCNVYMDNGDPVYPKNG